jgi:hypothetical protein
MAIRFFAHLLTWMLVSATALAADARKPTDPDKREAAAARREAMQDMKRGRVEEDPAVYEKNRLMRCNYLPAGDRQDCERRMRGEGTTSGSVEGGGIYRELRTVVPAE